MLRRHIFCGLRVPRRRNGRSRDSSLDALFHRNQLSRAPGRR